MLLGSFQIFKVCSYAKERVGVESNGKLSHLFFSSKTAARVPQLVVEDLPLSRTAALVPEFAMEDLPLGRILWWWWCINKWKYYDQNNPHLILIYMSLKLLQKNFECFTSNPHHHHHHHHNHEYYAQRQILHCKLRNLGCSLLGMDRCGSFPLLSAPPSLFSIWTDLKRSEKIPGAPTWRWGEWIWLTGPSGLHRNSPHRLISVPSGFLTKS